MSKELKLLITFFIFLALIILAFLLYIDKIKAKDTENAQVLETIKKINNDEAISPNDMNKYAEKINEMLKKNLYTQKKDKEIIKSLNDNLEENINNGEISKINL